MKRYTLISGALFLILAVGNGTNLAEQPAAPAMVGPQTPVTLSLESRQSLLDQYCAYCHDDVEKSGDMSLSGLDLAHVEDSAELAEKMIRKLRAGMMPPAGAPRPDVATLTALAASLEQDIDTVAAASPNPGARALQRLNRAEYARSIHELLAELEETARLTSGKVLTVRERMEEHRANPTCAACHRMIDPIGLALENFDPTGRWRTLDSGSVINPASELFDGTPLNGPASLRKAVLARSEAFIRNFTENLMSYGLGRTVEYYDMPTVRIIARDAAENDNRISSFILGVVRSPAFQMKRAGAGTTEEAGGQRQ